MDSYDVIIIGTGAGGGTLARHLAPSGKRILLLERGDWLPREPSNWLAQDVFVDNRYVSEDTWYDGDGQRSADLAHARVGEPAKPFDEHTERDALDGVQVDRAAPSSPAATRRDSSNSWPRR